MEPTAYVLREDHPLFLAPCKIDFSRAKDIPVPAAWSREFKTATIRVLPLFAKENMRYRDGWCTYTYEHEQAPELEVICGGVNAKTSRASAIWRQGNLLHFGFEQSPAEMNDTGRSLLINAITYAARFTEDVPIIRRSPRARILDRNAIERLIQNESRELESYFDWFFADELREKLRGSTRPVLAEWFRQNRGYLRADERGKFVIDEVARRFGTAPESAAFIPALVERFDEDDSRVLLSRYVPLGPGAQATADVWRAWHRENQPYLFFSDSGGFRWYLDPLAKKRRQESIQLRGIERGSASR